MIYLDYSATTPVDKNVLDTFNKVCIDYVGNSNSLHSLGAKSKELEEYSIHKISSILKVKDSEIIITSGASESNNTAIKGICLKYQNRGKHIITTNLEHSSIIAPLNYLSNLGFEIDFVNINSDGVVDLDHLKSLLRDDTILVSICAVDSELGLKQPINDIGELLKAYPKCYFHVDCTQAIGKVDIDFTNIDLASMSAHKIFGLKGTGILYKKENIVIEPLIHGGKSTTVYRSGTPALPLIVAYAKALELIYLDKDKHYLYVEQLSNKIKSSLEKYKNVYINSTNNSIPHVINFSLKGIKSETFIHALEQDEVYVSTKSACSSADSMSSSIYALTHDKERASSTIRISISHITTEEEITKFLEIFNKCYDKLMPLNFR